jgi:hypothetical protein
MNWFAAHLVLYVRFKKQPQSRFPVWENIVLFRAASEDEAFARAEHYGHAEEGDDDGSFHWDGEPACWVFVGVRKLTACVDPTSQPGDGTELTYLEMELDSREAVERLVNGEPVSVRLQDRFPATN